MSRLFASAMPSNPADRSRTAGFSSADSRAQSAAHARALRGSNVTVFTQDPSLAYHTVSGPIFGSPEQAVLGQTDDDILPAKNLATIVALKRDVLASGEARNAEVCVGEGASLRWYDLHLEPLRERDDAAGAVVGVGGVLVDITERKEGDAHLRLLMRELTHRSKNLLAVIQAMARQSAHHAGSIDGFLERFNGRLHALAAAHDLLVRESWYGVSLRELIDAQLAASLLSSSSAIKFDGPPVVLTPEAAQSLALAIHELISNAVLHGALSAPAGKVSLIWVRPGNGSGIEMTWHEQGGPDVQPRNKRGFGALVIEHNLVRALGARVDWSFEPAGICCEIAIPASHALPPR